MALTKKQFDAHRVLATQVEALYREIDKLAKKKPSDQLTPLISRKLNHVITKTRDQVSNDEFLDAIETVPVEANDLIRLDEALITLAELRSVLDRQWASDSYDRYRESNDRFAKQLFSSN